MPKREISRDRKIGLLDNTDGFYMAVNFDETTEEEFPINDL